MPHIATNGIQTYYEQDSGLADVAGEPLVLLHGFTGSMAQWTVVRPLLAAERRVIAYDLRGHGSTDAPDDLATYTMAAYAEDLRALLDALGVDRAHVLGSSFGGMVALEFALRYPERLRSLILSDTSAGPRCTELSEMIAAREDRITRELADAHAQGRSPFVERRPPVDGGANGGSAEQRADTPPRRITLQGFLGGGKARAERPDHHEDLGRLTMPVLIIAGDRDVLVPAAEYMHAHIPHSALRFINHAGHPAVADEPHGFVAMVRGFLAGLDPEHQHRVPPDVSHRLRGEDWGMRTRP